MREGISRERQRQTDRKRQRQRQKKTETERQRQADRQADRETDRNNNWHSKKRKGTIIVSKHYRLINYESEVSCRQVS